MVAAARERRAARIARADEEDRRLAGRDLRGPRHEARARGGDAVAEGHLARWCRLVVVVVVVVAVLRVVRRRGRQGRRRAALVAASRDDLPPLMRRAPLHIGAPRRKRRARRPAAPQCRRPHAIGRRRAARRARATAARRRRWHEIHPSRRARALERADIALDGGARLGHRERLPRVAHAPIVRDDGAARVGRACGRPRVRWDRRCLGGRVAGGKVRRHLRQPGLARRHAQRRRARLVGRRAAAVAALAAGVVAGCSLPSAPPAPRTPPADRGVGGAVATLLTHARRRADDDPPPLAAALCWRPRARRSGWPACTTERPCGEPTICWPSTETISRYSPEHDATSVTVYVPSSLSATTHCTAPGPLVRAATAAPPVTRGLAHRSHACTMNSHGVCARTGMGGGTICERDPTAAAAGATW